MRPTRGDMQAALQAHGSRIERYRQGQLTDDQFRAIRLSHGLYYQLDHTSYMQRIKLPGGIVSAAQADELAAIADDYARSVLHVTTRQDIQLHWVTIGDVLPILERLLAVGISTRGACSDALRNVTACSHSGVWSGELFGVTPYAFAVDEYFRFHPLNLTLPRKFKIGFGSCPYDCVQTRVNDIAFFPHIRDGRHGFSVYAGGGLGSQPLLAQLARDFIPAEDVLIVAEALVRLHHRDGERANRRKARLKYVFQRLGAARFLAEMDALVETVAAEQGDALRAELVEIVESFKPAAPSLPGAPAPLPTDGPFAHWLRTNTFAQKQAGYYGAIVRLPLGDVTAAQLRALAELTRRYGAAQLRTMNDQNIMVPWVAGDRLQAFYDGIRAIELATPDALHITDVVACPGADFCSLAVSRSMSVAEAIRNELLATNGNVESLGNFRIRISGCPNSCGQHHVGDIGLTGLSLKGADGQHHSHYSMLLGGRVGEDASAVGKRVPLRVPATQVPKVVAALADEYRRTRLQGERFPEFVDRVGVDRLTEVAKAVAEVPAPRL